jgi:hypothetical protein
VLALPVIAPELATGYSTDIIATPYLVSVSSGNSLIKESHGISRRDEEEGGVDDERGKDSVMKNKETAEVDASGDKSKRQASAGSPLTSA